MKPTQFFLLCLVWAGQPTLSANAAPPDASNSTAEASRSHCQALSSPTSSLVKWVSDWVKTAAEPTIALPDLVSSFVVPPLSAYLNPSAFPALNDRARFAKVPVIRYGDETAPEALEADLKYLQQKEVTPISLDQLITHLRTGLSLPAKPILLTVDQSNLDRYNDIYRQLKRFSTPAVFSVAMQVPGTTVLNSSTWQQLRAIAKDPLITISAYGSSDESQPLAKQTLEAQLESSVHYFTYKAGGYTAQTSERVRNSGYLAALKTEDGTLDAASRVAGESESLLAIERVSQSHLAEMVSQAWGGSALPSQTSGFDFSAPIQKTTATINQTPFIFISGGKPITIHAKSRYQVPDIVADLGAIAGVDGGFFSMKFLDSNVMIGPVYSQTTQKFVSGGDRDNLRLKNRPLVLISSQEVRFVPFDPDQHNSLKGLQATLAGLTDAFVAAAWLVRDSQPQPEAAFGNLFDFNAARHRAFWGINQAGQPTIGVSETPIGSVDLGKALAKAGYRDVVMLDSGASTSLAYKGESLVAYTPRPVPHVVALLPSHAPNSCVLAQR